MIRNIPNKYTQDMLLELFEKNHKKKFDFFYLPIDYNVSLVLYRTTVMLVMLFLISFILSLSLTFTESFTRGSGTSLTQSRFVKCVMLVSKVQPSSKITFSIRMYCSRRIVVLDL